jgi:hypothetical protein
MSSQPPPFPSTPSHGGTARDAERSNPLGTAALIVGIVAFVGAFIPLFGYLAVLIALVGIVLGTIALLRSRRRKGAAITGTVLSVIGFALSIVLSVVYTFVFFGALIGAATDSLETGEASLIYQVDGTGSDVDITYTTSSGDVQSTQQVTSQELPFEEEFVVGYGGADTYASYTLTAVNGADGGDVTCRILLDGRVLVEKTATGSYNTASCTASGSQLLE